MKKYFITLAILIAAASFSLSGCAKKTTEDPCNGNGTLNIENKLSSAITVQIVQSHKIMSIDKDKILPFTVVGDQPYEFKIDGPQYYKDTTFMVLKCDNNLFIVKK